jgi:signal transduction histidine kinase
MADLTLFRKTMAPTPRTMRWLAPFGVLAYLFLASAGFSLQVLAQSHFGSFSIAVQLPFYFLVGVWVAIGALIVWRHPENRIGWLLSLVMPLVALDLLAYGYVTYEATTKATSLLGAATLVWLKVTGMPFGMLLFAIVLLLFPNVRFLSSRWRPAAWVAVASFLAYLPLKALEPGPLLFVPGESSPLAVSEAGWALLRPLMWLALLSLTLAMGAGLLSLLLRFRRARGEERQQIKWLVAPAFLYFLSILVVVYAESASSQAILGLGSGMSMLAVTGMMVAMALAIFKYRLYDIDIIINRTLVYGVLTVSVVVIYVLIVGGLGALLQAEDNLLISLVATGLIAVLFQPMRERVQQWANRLFYGHRDDPLGALSLLGRRLEAAIDPEIVLSTLVEIISQTLKLPYVAISLRSGDEFKIAAESGTEVREALRIPLNYQGQTMGQLIAGPRGPGESFSRADRQLLETIAHQAGPAAYAVQLTEALRRSRVRLVTAREEERRRLRRDLHDGLGPVLASQGLKMAAVGQLLQEDPVKARQLLEELTAQNEATVAEIRRLVYELRPTALDDLGLVGAVRDYASSLKSGAQDSPRLHVEVQAPAGDLPSLPAAIEVAAYRISTEALTNIARHAQARRAAVSFGLVSGHPTRNLHLEIIDDGIGLPKDYSAGIGLISMRERAEEVGGNFLIDSSPGQGTRVVANLPLPEAA